MKKLEQRGNTFGSAGTEETDRGKQWGNPMKAPLAGGQKGNQGSMSGSQDPHM